jgi:hypothetical protein
LKAADEIERNPHDGVQEEKEEGHEEDREAQVRRVR